MQQKNNGVAVKCATITPNAARMEEYNLKENVEKSKWDNPSYVRWNGISSADCCKRN